MMHLIKKGNFSAMVSDLGAELKSFKNESTQTEFIWYGKPEFWYGTAPILFPIVGRLKDNEYILNGKTYEMPQHGFVRKMEFELVDKKPDSLQFVIRSNSETKKMFPFDFELIAYFKIENNRLIVKNTVINTSKKELLFTIGAHPAFNLPLEELRLSDYYVEFDKDEDLVVYAIKNGLIDNITTPYKLEPKNRITLNDNIFNEDALVFKNINSRIITIGCYKNDYMIKVLNTGDAPHIGIWSKPKAPYVCIEPWHGHADMVDSDKQFIKKEGIISLKENEEFITSYEIQV